MRPCLDLSSIEARSPMTLDYPGPLVLLHEGINLYQLLAAWSVANVVGPGISTRY